MRILTDAAERARVDAGREREWSDPGAAASALGRRSYAGRTPDDCEARSIQ